MMVSGMVHVSHSRDVPKHGQVPDLIMAMLKNVHLYFVNTANVEQEGDFWYWNLSYYGHDMMRVLVRASITGFSYRETFLEADSSMIPQIALMETINEEIHQHLLYPTYFPDWETLLHDDPYLHEHAIRVDLETFEYGIYLLMHRVTQGYYLISGNRAYPPRNKTFA